MFRTIRRLEHTFHIGRLYQNVENHLHLSPTDHSRKEMFR